MTKEQKVAAIGLGIYYVGVIVYIASEIHRIREARRTYEMAIQARELYRQRMTEIINKIHEMRETEDEEDYYED